MDPKLEQRIKAIPFPYSGETWDRPSKPTQICLHHTASGPGIGGDVEWWKRDGQPVSTPLIIDRDGTAYQLYPSSRWAYTLGLGHAGRQRVEALTLGVEIDTWGYLNKVGNKFYSYAKVEVPAESVCVLEKPHRGWLYYEKYTAEQIETVRLLLIYWGERYGIPLKFKAGEFFDLSNNAIYARVPGVYSHNSFRPDKTDLHPQPDLIAMLKSL